MTPAAIIQQAAVEGVKLAVSPTGTIKATGQQEAVTRWLPVIKEYKPRIVAALQEAANDPMTDSAAETRRQRVLAMLAERPDTRYALITDDRTDPEAVILAMAIRGAMPGGSTVTCELHVPRAKYDPFLLLDLIDRHGGTVH